MKSGDPTLLGWAITVGYLATAGLCLYRASEVGPRPTEEKRPRRVWLALGLFLVAMGLNKQLDLQLVVTDIGRRLAHTQGWYENRSLVQVAFVAVLGLSLLSLGIWLLLGARKHLRETALAFVGAAVLVAFVLLRAISFDVRDVLLRIGEANVTGALEILGSALIAIAALRAPAVRSNQNTTHDRSRRS